MDGTTLALAIVLSVAGLAIVEVLRRVLRQLRSLERSDPSSGLLVLQEQLDALREQVRSSLEGGRTEIDRRLQETNRVVGEVRRGLGEVDRQVRSVGEAARDLRGLQELLRSPKMRGGVGEYLLNELLAQVLPKAHYTLQYEFSGGDRVDAVLRLGPALVPIDAKFPLENFRRVRDANRADDDGAEKAALRAFRTDVRRHIDAIAQRYIRPGEGTYEFAMMYIPAEAVYQEVIRQEGDGTLDLFDHALSKRVVPVSPQSFYAYLQVIVLGLRGLSIEGRAREILGRVGQLQRSLEQFNETFDLAVKHFGNAGRQMDEAGRRLARVEAAVGGLASTTSESESGVREIAG